MHLACRSAIFVALLSSSCAYAHINITHDKQLKSENGLVISWESVSNDPQANQVEIFDEEGHVLARLNVLQPVREASRVSIYDVSARRGSMIAIAAVYGHKEGNANVRPASAMLLFDFSGKLLSAFALRPSREVMRLALDPSLNIWTLPVSSDDEDPAAAPMVVEYTVDGAVVKELLTRSMFPVHALEIQEDVLSGRTSMGYESGVVWFWLPGSTDLVIAPTDGGKPVMVQTHLPKKTGYTEVPLSIVRESSGTIVAEVREDGDDGSYQLAYYTWSPLSREWSEFKPGPCTNGRLIGVSGTGQVYAMLTTHSTDFCIFEGK